MHLLFIYRMRQQKPYAMKKTFIEQSFYLKSGNLYSCFNDSCLLTKTKLKIEPF